MKNWLLLLTTLAGAALLYFAVQRVGGVQHQGRSVQVWFRELTSDEYQVQSRARNAFLAMGEGAVPYLARELHAGNLPIQPQLERSPLIPAALKKTLQDAPQRRQTSLSVLASLGPRGHAALRAVIDNLTYPQPAVSLEAERVLRAAGPAGAKALMAGLAHRGPETRAACARVLSDCARGNPEALACLEKLIVEERLPSVRAASARSLGILASAKDAHAVEALTALLSDPAPEARAAGAEALAVLKSKSRMPIPALSRCLRDSSQQVRFQAARALWVIGAKPETILPVLIETLQHPETSWQSAYLLGEMKSNAAPAIPALAQALQREKVDRPLRSPPSTAFALGQIGRASIPALLPMFRSNDSRVRTSAAIAVGLMGPAGHEASDGLAPLLKDKVPDVRQASALAMASIQAGKAAMPVLIEMLHAEDIYVRMDAADALRKIDPTTDWQIASE